MYAIRSYYAGTSLDGCTIYVTHLPCSDCARAVIQAGIKRVVVEGGNSLRDDWAESNRVASVMFAEANIELCVITG